MDDKDYLNNMDDETEVLDYSPTSFNSQSNSLRREKLSKNKESLNPKDKVKNAAGNTMKTAGNVEKAAGNTMAAAGAVGSAAGKGAQVAGKGLQAGGKAVEAGTTAAGAALSAIPVVGTAAGAAVTGAGKVVGKGSQALGKGAEVAGKGAEKASDATKKAGNNLKKKGQSNIDAGNKIKNSTKKGTIKKEGNIVSDVKEKFTDKLKTKLKNNAKDAVNVDITKQVFKKIKKKIVIYLGIGLLGLVLLLVLIEIIFGPLIEAIQWMDEKWDIIADKQERVNNLYTGFGYQTTKEAFYEELDYLYEEYDHQIDIPLLMATLFYKEQSNLYNSDFGATALSDSGEIDDMKDSNVLPAIKNMLETKYHDLYEDLDEDGKNYTVGKIYRLRKLARNQMNTQVFGEAIPTDTELVSINEFLERSSDRLSDDAYQLLESLGSLTPTNFVTQFGQIINDLMNIFEGNENLQSLTSISEPDLAIKNLLKELCVTGSEISTIQFTEEGLQIEIFKYEYNEDNFKKYLKDYYIKNMPEFQEDVGSFSGEKQAKEIDKIIKRIYEYAESYKELYDYEDPNAGEYDYEYCVGNVNEEIVKEMTLPVKTSNSYSFDGENAFGVYDQNANNGVNLTEESAGVKEGADVYSILGGTVTEVKKSNNCNTSTDPTCDSRGNYVIIKHEKVKTDDSSTTIYSHYYNLKEKSVTVSKGQKVKKGTVIGKVGKTGNVTVPGLHFEVHTEDKTLNPTNIFIRCDDDSDSDSGSGSLLDKGSNKVKIWCYLTKVYKYPPAKAAGTMANLLNESGLEPTRVQGDYSNGYTVSKEYTKNVDSKKISKHDFVYKGPGGGGYGLAQWTSYGRKEGLYNYIKKNKKTSIGDLEGQLKYLRKELEGNGIWSSQSAKNTWKNAGNKLSDTDKATKAMMVHFERPYDQSAAAISGRQKSGRQFFKQLKNTNCASSSSSTSTSSSTSSSSSSNSKIVWLGDSRTVGMCNIITGKNCENKVISKDNDIFYSKVGEGYSWMVNTSVPKAKSYIKSGHNVVFLFGVNDLGNVKNYYKKINSYANEWDSKGVKVYFVSVNPVEEAKAKKYGYSVSNSSIKKFNKEMKENLNSKVKYINTNSTINFTTTDGVHYDAKTYKAIYNKVKSSLK